MRKLYLFLFLIIPAMGYCQDSILLPAEMPRELIIKHSSFVLSYNTGYVLPSWIAYKLTSEMIEGDVKVKEKYTSDPKITYRSAEEKDYRKTSYIMGQLVPYQDMMHSEQAISETFYMSNIVPQKPAFHNYMWIELMKATHQWLNTTDKLYIVAGPVFKDGPFGTIGKNKVSLPDRYYKIILDLKNSKAIGFIFDNSMSSRGLMKSAMSVDKIEEITGIDFFPDLPDEIENQVEAEFDPNKWLLEE